MGSGRGGRLAATLPTKQADRGISAPLFPFFAKVSDRFGIPHG